MARKKRGLSSEAAREVRQTGHDNAKLFALLLNMEHDYQNDQMAKKDVVDPSGDTHSLKSGAGKWQIFLYRRNRFIEDEGFSALNGVGSLLIHCIDAFPPSFEDYKKDPTPSKERLATPMRELKDKFQRKSLLRGFLSKSIFNGGEVTYLTVLDGDGFHVFHNLDVVPCFGNNFDVQNSEARKPGDMAAQKVVFKFNNNNVCEIEMRNDSPSHYQEVRFNMNIKKAMEMLYLFIPESENFSEEIFVHGKAIKKFGNWRKGK